LTVCLRTEGLSPVGASWFILPLAAVILFMYGCHSGGGGGVVEAEEGTWERGYFLDSAVCGLDYECASFKGTTEKDGGFIYRRGQTVTFSIGDIVLGATKGKSVVTPVDIGGKLADTSNTRVINIARLLQSLDNDRNPENGIVITDEVRQALKGIRIDLRRQDLDNDAGIARLFERLSGMGIYPEEEGALGLISAEEARLHLEDTVTQIELEEIAAEEALNNLPLGALIGNAYQNVIMIEGQSMPLVSYAYGGVPPYTYEWCIDNRAPFSTRANAGGYTADKGPDHTISLTVTDGNGSRFTAYKYIHIQPPKTQEGLPSKDSIPSARIIYPLDDAIFTRGETVTFLVTISQGDPPIYYGWGSDKPSNIIDGAGAEVSFSSPKTYLISQPVTLNAEGGYSINIMVQDTPVGDKRPDTHAASVRIIVR
jgi:hypothetical protein